jgi:quercetin dioxygenase-like cupin family protein
LGIKINTLRLSASAVSFAHDTYLPILNTMQHNLAQIPSRELVPGFHAKFIHTDHVTIGFVDILSGSRLPEHHHVHEQTTTVLEGKLELTVGGVSHILEAGQAVVIPSNVPHTALTHRDCKAMDVFSPVREDYKF